MEMNAFGKILVANRGEIAVRIIRAAHELDLKTVALRSEADESSLHCSCADETHAIGEAGRPLAAYLEGEAIADLAVRTGCDAVHPGYGFLSESAAFARACRERGLAFVGPSAAVMAEVADKIAARRLAMSVGVPCVPGISRPVDLETARQFGRSAGYPILLKAAGGGGGRGIRLCRSDRDVERLFPEAVRESESAFGFKDVFVERYVERPRHIEVQILGDRHGSVVHLFERDCSVQRRFQKVVEMAPAQALPDSARTAMLAAAVRIAERVGYDNAGTVEFLYAPETDEHFFMEVNARLQVEHTVTEEITGIDLVKAQIRIAEGARLDHPDIGIRSQESVEARGAAIQFRVTCDDPTRDFMPSFGRVTAFRAPGGPGVRVDEALALSGEITPHFDSLVAKVTTRGRDIAEAVGRVRRALAELRLEGVASNVAFLRAIAEYPALVSGDARTDFLDVHGGAISSALRAAASARTDDRCGTEARPSGAENVVSSLPGLVVRVDVAPGDDVEEDDLLLLIESMKIEMTVRSPVAGRVAEVRVRPGDLVTANDVLIIFEQLSIHCPA